jgi:8-oxo-dGTP pyrophosphatase MutT (NUDIX family)
MAIELSEILHAFQLALPGEKAHREMMPVGRSLTPPSGGTKLAAVLCLLYPVENQWHIVFIQRASKNAKDKHSGQIGFPGGMFEADDKDLLACAMREAKEEIGLDLDRTTPIGALSPLYIPVSNFQVHPFLAYTHHRQEFIPQLSEVSRILTFSVEELLHPGNIKSVFVKAGNPVVQFEVPAYSLDKAVIWGATAMMLHECILLIKQHLDLP